MSEQTPDEGDLFNKTMTLHEAINGYENGDIEEFLNDGLFAPTVTKTMSELETELAVLEMKVNLLVQYISTMGTLQPVSNPYGHALIRKLVEWGVITKDQMLQFECEFQAWFIVQLRENLKGAQEQIAEMERQRRMQMLLNGGSPFQPPQPGGPSAAS